MSRIQGCFERLRRGGRRALVTFITAGDPEPGVTVPLMHGLAAAGADILELGVPFSDPMADGPVIQRASERALARHVTLRKVLEMVSQFRADDTDTPVVLMGYLNPFEVMGYADFAQAAAAAGVDGVLTVDLPPEEAGPFLRVLRDHGMDPIFLLAPTSDERRLAQICGQASGFVYYVSLKGVTGAAHLDVSSVAQKVASIKAVTDLPVGVGFGIRDPDSAARVAAVSDAVVVGSAIVKKIESLADTPDKVVAEVSPVVARLREAIDRQMIASSQQSTEALR